jgi:multisubunit Na+/H+ antiporter MnhF subunit
MTLFAFRFFAWSGDDAMLVAMIVLFALSFIAAAAAYRWLR